MARIKVGNLEIGYQYLDYVIADISGSIQFTGKALEETGRRIHAELQQMKKGDIVEFEAETSPPFTAIIAGICEIADLNLQVESQRAPVIYKFSGRLQRK